MRAMHLVPATTLAALARRLALAAPLLAVATPGLASDEAYWEFGDWRVSVVTTFGEEHAYTECVASTGGDGDPMLVVRAGLIDGEVHEPPFVEVVEQAMRGMTTAIVDGGEGAFTFADGTQLPTSMFTAEGEDGPLYPVGHAYVRSGLERAAFWAMRHGDTVDVAMSPEWTQTFSLSGFTASLGKLAEHCGVDVRGVID